MSTSSTTCPYALLNLPYEASEQDIKRAYANAVARIRAAIGEKGIPEQLDAVRSAFRLLADPRQRQHYDLQRRAVAATTADRKERINALIFDGSGKVYFRIWITNLLLSFLSLGIYSAWAKVRREQYFHRHLRLDGAAFDYHGSPLAILKGRLLLALILALYSLTRLMPPALHALVVVATLLLVPWIIVRSLQFRAANTSYRGLRFSFRGGYREALSAYLGYGLLTLLTLGLTLPLMMWRQKQFVIANLGYGAHGFGYYATRRMFYRALWLPTLLVFLPFGGFIVALLAMGKTFLALVVALTISKAIVPLLMAAFLIFQLIVVPYARMKSLNVAWSSSRLDQFEMRCSQGFAGYGATHVSNWLLTLLTLGLFWPWAMVRALRYRARHFAVASGPSLDGLRAGRRQSAAALGGEAAGSLGMDVGL